MRRVCPSIFYSGLDAASPFCQAGPHQLPNSAKHCARQRSRLPARPREALDGTPYSALDGLARRSRWLNPLDQAENFDQTETDGLLAGSYFVQTRFAEYNIDLRRHIPARSRGAFGGKTLRLYCLTSRSSNAAASPRGPPDPRRPHGHAEHTTQPHGLLASPRGHAHAPTPCRLVQTTLTSPIV